MNEQSESMRIARKPFPLRLPVSVHGRANEFAQREGISLNQFVTLAIAEKLTRLEQAGHLLDLYRRETQPIPDETP
jgi:hypothetical protein